MQYHAALGRALAVVVALAGLACETSSPVADAGPGRDAAGADVGDAARDASTDADGTRDAADAADAPAPPVTCTHDRATDFFELDFELMGAPRRFAAAGGPTSFGLAYSKREPSGREDVYFVEVPSGGGTPRTTEFVTTDGQGNTAPVVARTSAGWVVGFLSRRDGNTEVYTAASASGSFAGVTPHRVTSTASIDETSLGIAASTATTALAWAEPGASPITVVQPVDGAGLTRPGAARLSVMGRAMVPTAFTTTDWGYLVGWVEGTDAWLQPVAMDLTLDGEALALTAEHNADGTIDAQVEGGGGAVVYGVITSAPRHDVHGHMLNAMGGLYFAEQGVTTGTDTGTDAAIVELGGGFAVAYRQSDLSTTLRVLFMDALLHETGRIDLGNVAAAGGPITARVSADGNLLLTWNDLVGTTIHMRTARLRCH